MNKNILTTIAFISAFLFASTAAQAQGGSTGVGGGGDPLELRVSEIRNDILSWISAGGANGLSFSGTNTDLNSYRKNMIGLLKPRAVIVTFTDQKVIVSNEEKTCKGYLEGQVPHIKCNIHRFPINETAQYRLVHHEFAGLAGAEHNIGASSDYILSNQITKSLTKTTVLKLAVNTPCNNSSVICKGDEVLVLRSDGSRGTYRVLATSNNHTSIKIEEYSFLMGGDLWVTSKEVRKVVKSGNEFFVGQDVETHFSDGSGSSHKITRIAGEYVELNNGHSDYKFWVLNSEIRTFD